MIVPVIFHLHVGVVVVPVRWGAVGHPTLQQDLLFWPFTEFAGCVIGCGPTGWVIAAGDGAVE